jgi:peptidoglycan/xylan/chitin deacetylase (PgdA/CDA1 family)
VSPDELRSARLLFAEELGVGVTDASLGDRSVRRALRRPLARLPRPPLLDAVALRAGLLGYERSCAARQALARLRLLGPAAPGQPRVLVRVDEFPHARVLDDPRRFGEDAFARFHAIMARHRVPYLLAVTPRVSRRYLEPFEHGGRSLDEGERRMLAALAARGTELALHHLTHRTRDPRPRRRSAVAGLSRASLGAELDAGIAALGELGVRPRVYVPPFNRFDRGHFEVLAERFDVICAGPETVAQHGFAPTPVWRGSAVLLSSYAPLYGSAAVVRPALERLAAAAARVWAPLTLHWGWESDAGFAELERLAELLGQLAVPWSEFLTAVDASR